MVMKCGAFAQLFMGEGEERPQTKLKMDDNRTRHYGREVMQGGQVGRLVKEWRMKEILMMGLGTMQKSRD